LQLLRAAGLVARPWKNGGGVTREIAAWPPGAGLDAFDWRVSAAEVATDGPFSRFPGIERVLLVTRGAGLRLAFDGGEAVLLTPESPPFRFSGEAAVGADLVDGPVADLNVMARQGLWTARVRRLPLDARAELRATETLLAVALKAARVRGGATLAPGDALVLTAGETVAFEAGGAVAEVDLRRVP
jgi:environmental stress-induced protein Ves